MRQDVSGERYAGVADGGMDPDAPTTASSAPAHRSPLTTKLETLAERLLASAKAGPPNRNTALSLLAADTLITLACEAAAAEEAGRAPD